MWYSQNITSMTFLIYFFYLIRKDIYYIKENCISAGINKPSKAKQKKKITIKDSYKNNLLGKYN